MRGLLSVQRILLAAAVLLVLLPGAAGAQWTTDGTPVCAELLYQGKPGIVSDGAGGAIMTWYDQRGGTYDIYAQRIDKDGYIQWATNGALVCASTGNATNPLIVTDDAGGAFIVWRDDRNGNQDIYAQRIDPDGNSLWTANGIGVCTEASDQGGHAITADNMGGMSVVWMDYRNAENDLYMQRIDEDGVKAWAADGRVVCDVTGSQYNPRICYSGVGGNIIVWEDRRGASRDIYAQYMNQLATRVWGADGLAICTTADEQWEASIAPDGANGVYIVWVSGQIGVYTTYEVYAQRVNFSGTILWPTNGNLICDIPGRMRDPQVMQDGDGGAIICWDSPGRLEEPWAWSWGVFASKVDGNGVPQWGDDGLPIYQFGSDGGGTATVNTSQLVTDGFGGAVVAWDLGYIRAQRVDTDGNLIWGPDGKYATHETTTCEYPQLVSDGAKGAIITWQEERTPANGFDVYAQRLMTQECAVSRDTLNFGSVPIGQFKYGGFQIRNTGGVTLTGSVTTACPYFSVASVEPSGNPFVLEAGEGVWVSILFEPTVEGTFYCTVETGDSVCWDVECVGIGFDCPTGVIYVDASATGTDDGTSWTNAFTDLQDAFALAEFCGTIDEIWVAAGTYTPTSGTDRSVSFVLQHAVDVYGGCAGTETMLSERDAEANPTILSGDLGGAYSYHVVTSGTSMNYLDDFDGFIISDGVADGVADVDQRGGGMYNEGGPSVRNCTFMDNTAVNGGGMYCEGSQPRLYDVTFENNTATGQGGGMYCNELNPYITGAAFRNNAAGTGGGIYVLGASTTTGFLRNVVFETNNGGGMYNNASSPDMTNVVFYGNYGVAVGGGLHNLSGSSPEMVNVSFGYNAATSSSGGMANGKGGCSPTVINAIFWGNTAPLNPQVGNIIFAAPVFSYSIIEGCGGSGGGWDANLGTDGGDNLDMDPRWITGYSSEPMLSLWASSPAINTGSNAAVPGAVTTDAGGNPRFYDVTVDRGAYEYQGASTDVDEDLPQVPEAFALYQNTPNPFNPVTTIRFDLPHAEHVKLIVYNVKGELVATLADQNMTAGSREITWNAKDSGGRTATSGVYFYRLVAGDFVQTKKMILLR